MNRLMGDGEREEQSIINHEYQMMGSHVSLDCPLRTNDSRFRKKYVNQMKMNYLFLKIDPIEQS